MPIFIPVSPDWCMRQPVASKCVATADHVKGSPTAEEIEDICISHVAASSGLSNASHVQARSRACFARHLADTCRSTQGHSLLLASHACDL